VALAVSEWCSQLAACVFVVALSLKVSAAKVAVALPAAAAQPAVAAQPVSFWRAPSSSCAAIVPVCAVLVRLFCWYAFERTSIVLFDI
jgi:hypothetical protein